MNKQQLANKIWESANKMRSKIEANEYKDYILGFIFYKFLSDQEVKFLKENDFTDEDIQELSEDDPETVEYVQKNIGYFIEYKNLFSTWLTMGRDFNVSNVRDALSAFSRLIYRSHKRVFEGIFRTLETGLSKLGDNSGAQTKAINGLLQLIKDIPMDGRQDYDVLGFIYEYLISMFAANAGKKAGEFYTPHEVSILMSEIIADHLKDEKEIKIYDPTSGSGSLLINIGRSVSKYMEDKNNVKYYAQEIKENTFNLTRMNLVMQGIKPDNIIVRNGDTLEDDWPYFDEADPVNTYDPLFVNAVVANPPYSQAWDPSNKENDPRFAQFGLAPKSKADYAFLLHNLFHVQPNGIMTIVLPHGVLFRGGEEGIIRKNLIDHNHIDTVIGLPANIFFGTSIPTVIMTLKKQRKEKDVLIIDASKGFVKEGKNNKLRASDIKRIVDVVVERKTVDNFSRVVTKEEIRANDYNLNIPRYVDSSEKAESFDIYASMFGGVPEKELRELKEYWDAFPSLKESLFTMENEAYSSPAVSDIKDTIKTHPDIHAFCAAYEERLKTFPDYLKTELIENMEQVPVAREENVICQDLFARLSGIPLIDPYEAYQVLDDAWKEISADLEMIQTEGVSAITKVDPKLVLKKEKEVQEGWAGHILPFSLVQESFMKDVIQKTKQKETRLLEIPSEYEEIIESLEDTDVLNEAGDAFVPKEVAKKIKEIKSNPEEKELLKILQRVESLQKEEKSLKADIKKETAELEVLTKEKIESLSERDAKSLLEKKWIDALYETLMQMPEQVISEMTKKIEVLCGKYNETFSNIEKEIKETSRELCSMIDELEGSEFDKKGLEELKALLAEE
ncbi:MAG: type I restriction-modification system subunit M [Lachnospiraceae bacterium]|nr:type I restriction-modification system subunit M [Lachnospiraceae bacterium]